MAIQTIELCTESDLPELFERFKDWYRYNPRLQEREYFDWQFKNTPRRLTGGEFDFLLLRESGQIAGCLGFAGFDLRLDHQVKIAAWTHNWHAPNQRGGALALLSRFFELADDRFLLRYTEHTENILTLLRVPMLSPLPRWWAAIDARAAADIFEIAKSDRGTLTKSADLLQGARDSGQVAEVVRFDPSEEFGFSHLAPAIHGATRNGRYLNWRYLDIPSHNYQAVRSETEFAVFRTEPVMGKEYAVIRILEWTFGPRNAGTALRAILQLAADTRPCLIDFFCTCPAAGAVLGPFGFVTDEALSQPMPDMFRPTNYSGGIGIGIDLPPHRTRRTIDFSQWYITRGDSDIDRVKL